MTTFLCLDTIVIEKCVPSTLLLFMYLKINVLIQGVSCEMVSIQDKILRLAQVLYCSLSMRNGNQKYDCTVSLFFVKAFNCGSCVFGYKSELLKREKAPSSAFSPLLYERELIK
jgi:hypothetical protein